MSNLPPYSTFRTDSKQMMFPKATSHGNILTFTPPGFKQSLNVKFPDSRLAVCAKCKKNFKTRDMCRVRNGHTGPPWTTAYICVTLDDSCTDENGKYIDAPLTLRMVQWQPYCVTSQFGPKTPVCSACKRTNRTRAFCRERHKHKQLPWCTVYVLLSAYDAADPATIVAGASKPLAESTGDEKKLADEKPSPKDGSSGKDDAASAAESRSSDPSEPKNAESNGTSADEGDDINDIPESRTFLAMVSCQQSSITWLKLADVDAETQADAPAVGAPPLGEPYYAQMTMAHHNALRSHQQYFFHMQQQHQPHPQYVPHPGWHYQYPPQHMQPAPPVPPIHPGEKEDDEPPTAGEAAARLQKRAGEAADSVAPTSPAGPLPPPNHAQQNWMLYQQMYQAQLPPPPLNAPPYHSPDQAVKDDGDDAGTGSDDVYAVHETEEANVVLEEDEEAGAKRQRLE